MFGRCHPVPVTEVYTYDVSPSVVQRFRILLEKLSNRGTTPPFVFFFCFFLFFLLYLAQLEAFEVLLKSVSHHLICCFYVAVFVPAVTQSGRQRETETNQWSPVKLLASCSLTLSLIKNDNIIIIVIIDVITQQVIHICQQWPSYYIMRLHLELQAVTCKPGHRLSAKGVVSR